MIIDIKEVLSYTKCPMLYKHKYITKGTDKYISVVERYEEDLQKAAFSFFYKVQGNEVVNIETLKKAWGRLWINKKSSEEFIYSETGSWRDTINLKRKNGINSLIKFYDNFKDDSGIPLVINQPYKVIINKNITLTGHFDLVREKDKYIDIIDFKAEDKHHNMVYIANNLETTAMSLAFRHMFEETEDRLYFYGFNKGKFYPLHKEEKDYALLENTIISVAKCIRNELFYASPDAKCLTCVYKRICLK